MLMSNRDRFNYSETFSTFEQTDPRERTVKISEPILKEETSFKTVDYSKLTAVLIKAIQEQNKKIDKLQEDIEKLRGDD